MRDKPVLQTGSAEGSPSRGCVTIAVRKRSYLEMAVDMRLSLAEHSDLPLVLGADWELAASALEDFPGVFDDVVRIDDRYRVHRAMQFAAGQVSPFDHTLFIDADCLVLSDPGVLWPDEDAAPVVLTGQLLRAGDEDWNHHGFSTGDLIRKFDLDGYLKCNGGVFYFRGTEGRLLLEECLATYVDEVLPRLSVGPWPALGIPLRGWLGGFLGAELAFGIVGGRRGFGTFPHPGPMYWPGELAELDPRKPWKPVCHWIGPLRREAFQHLLEETRRRRREAGVRDSGTAHWEAEDRRLGGAGP